MAFYLSSELNQANRLEVTAGADKTKGDVEVIGTIIGFWFESVLSGEDGTVVIGGNLYTVDCDNTLAYTAGDAVFQDTAAITGVVNKTSGGTNVIVGYAAKNYPIGTSKILIVPKAQ